MCMSSFMLPSMPENSPFAYPLTRMVSNQVKKGVSYMFNRIDRVVVDFAKTFGEPGIFLGVEPKMQRSDKDDPNSPQAQAHDKNNPKDLKWVAEVAVKIKNF